MHGIVIFTWKELILGRNSKYDAIIQPKIWVVECWTLHKLNGRSLAWRGVHF